MTNTRWRASSLRRDGLTLVTIPRRPIKRVAIGRGVDGIGNNADTDDDGDDEPDLSDAFPLDPAETTDTDGDGIGNNADTDDDGDGVEDNNDGVQMETHR